MKSFLKPFVLLGALAFLAPQAMAQIVNQTPVGNSGEFAAQDQTVGPTDPWLAKAYDNFTLTQDILIEGFCWHGLYAEPFPAARADTDFIIEIWDVDPNNQLPDVAGGALLTFTFEGGVVAGTSGSDLTVTDMGYDSAPAGNSPGGGDVFHYDATLANGTALAAGDYWISILADQTFPNPFPKVDPEWQWHFAGAGDGFTTFDRTTMPPGTNQQGLLVPGKDLAFAIKGVPEPSTILMALCGLAPLGLLRRKRS